MIESMRLRGVLGFLMAGSLLGGSVAAPAATTLLSSDQQVAGHPAVRTVEYFGQLVAQRTKGELTVVVKPDGALGGEQDAIQNVQAGKQAMARVNLGTLSDKVPAAELASLPYLFRSSDHMWKVLKGDFGNRLDQEMARAGMIRLMYLDSGARDFYCKKPIRSQEDFKGLKVRILQSKVFEELIANLGAKAVPIAFNKVSDALRKGEIDCAEGGVVNYMAADHAKLAPYLMQDEHMLMPDILVMSKKIWDGLSPAQQDVLKKAGQESTEYMAKLWRDQEASALANAKKSGVTVIARAQISMTAIEAQAIKTYNKYVKSSSDLETVMRIVTTK